MNFSRKGFLRVDQMWGWEHWAGQRFKRGRPRAFGNVQLFRWLALDGGISAGRAVFYDPIDPFQGCSLDYNAGATLQPSGRFSQRIGYQRVAFDHAITASASTRSTSSTRERRISSRGRWRCVRSRSTTARASAC